MTPRGCCEHGDAAKPAPPVGDQPCLVPGGATGKDSRGFGHTENTGSIGAARELVQGGLAEGRGAGRECTPVVSGRGSSAVGPCQNVKVGDIHNLRCSPGARGLGEGRCDRG